MAEIKMSYIFIEKQKHESKTMREILLEIIDNTVETRDDEFLKVERTTGSDNAQSKPVTPITIVKAEMIDDDADGNHRVQFTMNF